MARSGSWGVLISMVVIGAVIAGAILLWSPIYAWLVPIGLPSFFTGVLTLVLVGGILGATVAVLQFCLVVVTFIVALVMSIFD